MDLIKYLNNDTWIDFFKEESKKEYFKELDKNILNLYETKKIYPPKELIFNAFNLVSFEDIKVIILGQDPYINEGEADGLAFSVSNTKKIPPSLKNIYKEIENETGKKSITNGSLINLAKQGVFLLNTCLTVESKKSNSHKNIGWTKFTDNLIKYIDLNRDNIVFLFWGNNAKNKKVLLNNKNNICLEAAHPSPLARGAFFGCNHFNMTNDFLKSKNIKEIVW